ncbi:hypothetical protein K457DRAFT_873851 [Linnemannia elongata AG-77]|uniref:Uncharacterized protein n=1 Tax=Linnemannia elongata AG-77 TaxID=1314771 RepID=A0A197JHY6_9FUNG|nr:hypothetical protein K457DRAFT_873851 [Linnemannia elongata AG-77]
MSSISDLLVNLMFNRPFSGAPKPPTQTRAQCQQQLQYPASRAICCIQLHDNDKIRLINAPPSLIPLLRQTIGSSWNQPILQEISKVYCQTYEFWVGGKPWAVSSQTGPSLSPKNLVLAMNRAMEEAGWSLVLASNVSRVREENDSLFFEWTGGFPGRPWLSSQQQQQQQPVQVQEKDINPGPWLASQQQQQHVSEKDTNPGPWLASQQQQQQVPVPEKDANQMTLTGDLSGHRNAESVGHQQAVAATVAGVESFTVEFFGYDTIRVPTEVPVAILTALRLAVLRHWTQGIEREGDKKGIHEYILTGCPFQTWGTETTVEVSMVIIQALENMRLHGYKLCREAMDRDVVGVKTKTQDEKGKKKEKKEKVIVDTWVLRRMQ